MVKNLPANARDTKTLSLLPKYPLEKEMETHSMILAWENPTRSLAGYSPVGHRGLDVTERLSTHCLVFRQEVKCRC